MTPEILISGLPSGYDIEHLARVFYPGAVLRQSKSTRGALVYARAGRRRMAAGLRLGGTVALLTAPAPDTCDEKERKRVLSGLVYRLLQGQTGLRPPWGMLTGVRPVNHLRKRTAQLGEAGADRYFLDTCHVSGKKLAMARQILDIQRPVLARHGTGDRYSLYVSIPFCPTRCAYCSFVSRTIQREAHLVEPYLDKLEQELAETARVAAACGLTLSSVYIGGGTPTALDEAQLERLLRMVERHFSPAQTEEYTVEAGRPDCTGFAKLKLLRDYGVHRISINPQTLRDEVLQNIGRKHTAADVLRCFDDARRAGHVCINMDLIAGLPGDDPDGFAETLAGVLALAPENVTLHTLTLKRASNLVIDGQGEHAAQTPASGIAALLAAAYPRLAGAGYAPYYLYRQKNTVENLENTGWCLPGTEGLYNICIMEEAHTILAVGAGASTKLVAQGGAKIQRRYNHKLPLEYIQNFDEILARKKGVTEFYARDLDTQTTG